MEARSPALIDWALSSGGGLTTGRLLTINLVPLIIISNRSLIVITHL